MPLRTLDFKAAVVAVREGASGDAKPLTLDAAKASLRGFAAAYRGGRGRGRGRGGHAHDDAAEGSCWRQAESEPLVANGQTGGAGGEGGAEGGGGAGGASVGVEAAGFAAALGLDSASDPAAAAAWSAVVAASGESDDAVHLDFQKFLVGCQRARPAPAVAKGWVDPPPPLPDDTRV